MPSRKPKKPTPARKQPESTAELRQTLSKRTKAELVDTLLELAQPDRRVLRQLTARFDVAAAADEVLAATRQAIADATAFDERDINHNFAYDPEAYGERARAFICCPYLPRAPASSGPRAAPGRCHLWLVSCRRG
jgi:hypothetical protein